ncbi:glycosyltransferase family 2 protein [Butyricicoccus sp.]|uniref:glycosyltransferase family 2 protein n=1 Tax=Butyricicoccus sp. TaxID=2049021 RepID=UPI003F15ED4D
MICASKEQTGMPEVSVVMPAYHAEPYIERAVRSVLEQTMQDFELIIIDDCSQDGTYDMICSMAAADSRIRPFRNEVNAGVAATRNRALDLCRGQYVALLDSDDIWHADKLEQQLAVLRQHQADLVYCSYALMDEHGRKKCQDYIVPAQTDFEHMLRQNCIGCSTVMFTREIAEKYRFRLDFYHEDYVLWLQLLQDGYRAHGITKVLVDYRVMEQSRAGNKKASAGYRWKIYRDFLHLSLPKRMLVFVQYSIAGIKKYRKIR